MPTYTYQCRSCGKSRDICHAISANPRVKCEDCGKGSKRLLGTGSGIIFKGSGFHVNDYGPTGKKKPATPESSILPLTDSAMARVSEPESSMLPLTVSTSALVGAPSTVTSPLTDSNSNRPLTPETRMLALTVSMATEPPAGSQISRSESRSRWRLP